MRYALRFTLAGMVALLMGIDACSEDNDQDGWTNTDGDCDDNDSSIHPGAAEVPYDGIDQDCDGSDLSDVDGDGHGAQAVGGDDCDDGDADLHPGAPETWDDCIDSDCDGVDFTVGDGQDGDLEVSGGAAAFDQTDDSLLTAEALAGDTTLTVSDASGFDSDDIILVRTALSSDPYAVGTWELARVNGIDGATLSLETGLRNSYASSDTVRVARVRQYENLTLESGASLSAADWSSDGNGGVLALLVHGTLTLATDATLGVPSAGYAGGARSTSATQVGQQGESQAGTGSRTTSANVTGGGGGSAPSVAHADGGGGGYGTAGATGGNYPGYSTTPGSGGSSWGDDALTTLHFGGAGGSGGLDADPGSGAYGGAGGDGGGAMVLLVSSLALDGTLSATGGNGENGQISGGASPGGGGGGAGGSIYLEVATVASSTGVLDASGGSGGQGSEAGSSITYGGDGGDGRIRVEAGSSLTATPAAVSACTVE